MASEEESETVDPAEWSAVIDDAETIVDDYESSGWDAYLIRPTGVYVHGEDSALGLGFEVEVGADSDAFATVYDLVTEAAVAFDDTEVYAASGESATVLVVVMRSSGDRVALAIPLAYGTTGERMLEAADEAGEVRTVLRATDSDEDALLFAHGDPSIFRP